MSKNQCKIFENSYYKGLSSSDYKFLFNKGNGVFLRWGKTVNDDPSFSPFGPEILDLEIDAGECSGNCKFCYKQNGIGSDSHHMTFDEFKIIFDKMPKVLTQIAFGICDVDSNPDFFKMMEYARNNGVIPNYTCNGLKVTDKIADKTAELCGAVAVSLVNEKETFETIRKFLSRKMTQVNMHYMLSEETYSRAFDIIDKLSADPSLRNFNAIVFLQYKPKGRNADSFHSVLDVKKYKILMNYCDNRNINYGFDSCSAPIFLESIKGRDNEEKLEMMAEPCESGLFSSYINCEGQFFVCSFAEGEHTWTEGIDVLGCENFLRDVWHHPRLEEWRKELLANNRKCPIYTLSTI